MLQRLTYQKILIARLSKDKILFLIAKHAHPAKERQTEAATTLTCLFFSLFYAMGAYFGSRCFALAPIQENAQVLHLHLNSLLCTLKKTTCWSCLYESVISSNLLFCDVKRSRHILHNFLYKLSVYFFKNFN